MRAQPRAPRRTGTGDRIGAGCAVPGAVLILLQAGIPDRAPGWRRAGAASAPGGGLRLGLGGALGIGVRSGRRRARQPAAAADLRPHIAGIETGGAGPHPGLVAEILRRPARRGGIGDPAVSPGGTPAGCADCRRGKVPAGKIGGSASWAEAGAPVARAPPSAYRRSIRTEEVLAAARHLETPRPSGASGVVLAGRAENSCFRSTCRSDVDKRRRRPAGRPGSARQIPG